MKMRLKKTNLLKTRIPFPVVLVLVPLAACAAYFVRPQTPAAGTDARHGPVSTMEQVRRENYEFTRPLILANATAEDPRLDTIMKNIAVYIGARTQDGMLQTASIYLRIVNTGAWAVSNGQERYSAGSLLKLPLLIYFLKESESDPSILGKGVYFQKHFEVSRKPQIVEQPLKPGSFYTVEELLRRMIVYSDNDATILLNNLAGPRADGDVFDALHLMRPDWTSGDYFIGIEEYSRFFRVLFNATYLEPSLSDYALKLLAQSSFKGGLMRPIDPSIKVPRKFAERGTKGVSEFHEMGIVYLRNEPYLLGVMTKGRDLTELENVVADVSQIVFSQLSKAAISFLQIMQFISA